ncbi:MAG: signal recognition particle protein, partial [Pseudomonadota bacterium]
DKILARQIALINSMTKKERAAPQLLQASRKKRIAKGAGLEVSELNKLLKQHRQMSDMMKKMGKRGGLAGIKNLLGGGGPSEAQLQAAQQQMMQGGMQLPKGMSLPGLGGLGKK